MGILDDIRLKGASYRLTEEAIYEEVIHEIESGLRRDGLWAMAISEHPSSEASAKARYIALRVQSLKDEIVVARAVAEQQAKVEDSKLRAIKDNEAAIESAWQQEVRNKNDAEAWFKKSNKDKKAFHRYRTLMWVVILSFIWTMWFSDWWSLPSHRVGDNLFIFVFFPLVVVFGLSMALLHLIESFKSEPRR